MRESKLTAKGFSLPKVGTRVTVKTIDGSSFCGRVSEYGAGWMKLKADKNSHKHEEIRLVNLFHVAWMLEEEYQ